MTRERESALATRTERALEASAAVRSLWVARTEPLAIERDGLTLVIDREPGLLLDHSGDAAGVDAWLRLYDAKGNEIPIDPHRRILNPPLHPRSDVTFVVREEETVRGVRTVRDRVVAPVSEQGIRDAIFEALWDSVLGQPHAERWERAWHTGKGTVTTVYATAPGGAGSVRSRSTASYSAARTGATLSARGNHEVGQDSNGSDFWDCFESFLIFDTSGLPDDDEVTGVVASFYLEGDDTDTNFVIIAASSPYDGGAVVTGDWVAGGSLAGSTTYASFDTAGISAGYNAFTSADAAFNAAINKTGNTPLMLYSSRQAGNNSPSNGEFVTFYDADAAGTTQDAKLDITHESPGAPGPQHYYRQLLRGT